MNWHGVSAEQMPILSHPLPLPKLLQPSHFSANWDTACRTRSGSSLCNLVLRPSFYKMWDGGNFVFGLSWKESLEIDLGWQVS